MAGRCGIAVKLLVVICLIAFASHYTNEAFIAWKESPTGSSKMTKKSYLNNL
jgi:hypothetical protein